MPYEIADLKSINVMYGRDGKCWPGEECLWRAEVLNCSEDKSLALSLEPKLDALTDLLSQIVSGRKTLNSSSYAELISRSELILAHLPEIEKLIRKSAKPDSQVIFDLIDSARSMEEHEDKLSRMAAQQIHKLMWPLIEAFLDREDLDESSIWAVIEFVRNAHGYTGNPMNLMRKIVEKAQKILKGDHLKVGGRTFLMASFFVNMNVDYGDAQGIIGHALEQSETSSFYSPEAMASTFDVIRKSKSNLGDRNQHLIRLVNASLKSLSQRFPNGLHDSTEDRPAADLLFKIAIGLIYTREDLETRKHLFKLVYSYSNPNVRKDIRSNISPNVFAEWGASIID